MINYILIIDAGTTGVQASLFDTKKFEMFGNIKAEFKQYYPNQGYVEHNPNEIWHATNKAVMAALESADQKIKNFSVNKIIGIGLTNQRETCVGWNLKTHESPFHAIVWQDRRTAPFCHKIKGQKSIHDRIKKISGLVCDPYFSATKYQWMLKNNRTLNGWAKKHNLAFGTIDSFLIWKLTGHKRFVTDHTNASRTMLYSLKSGTYSEELLKFFKIPKNSLPYILPSEGEFGKTHGLKFLPDGIPICAVLGDQQSALYGQQCTQKGEIKITYGTGAFILMNIGQKPQYSKQGLITTVAFSNSKERTFALEGSAFIAGAAVQFLRDNFEWFNEAEKSEDLALKDPRDPNLIFIPAFAGLGSPYWNPYAKGALLGLTRGTSKSQIVRSVLESIALQNVELLKIFQKEGKSHIPKISVDGGGSANNFMMQFQTDVLQKTLVRPSNLQTTSIGVALAAYENLMGSKFNYDPRETIFKPHMIRRESHKINSKWAKALEAIDNLYRSVI